MFNNLHIIKEYGEESCEAEDVDNLDISSFLARIGNKWFDLVEQQCKQFLNNLIPPIGVFRATYKLLYDFLSNKQLDILSHFSRIFLK